MKSKLMLAAVLVTVGSAAAAMGCGKGHQKQVMSCGEGYVWDSNSQSCMSQTTS